MIKLIKSTFYDEMYTKTQLCSFIAQAETLSMGGQCRAFEKAFAAKQKRKHAAFFSSGSAANLVLVQSLLNLGRLKKGDTIAFSSLTWPTNVMPLIQLGLEPFYLDCELSNLNVSKNIMASYYKKNIRAFFITNVLGFCADLDNIRDFCVSKKIILLEDNCESLGSIYKKTLLGNFSLASTFSTFVGHHLSTIEGGIVATDDENLYDMLTIVRAHGWTRNLSTSKKNALKSKNGVDKFYDKYTFYDLAFNARPTEIQGFLGNLQIENWDEIVRKRSHNFYLFNQTALKNSDITPLDVSHMDIVSNFAMPVIFRDRELFIKYKKKFEENDVEIRPVIAGDITKQPFYRKYARCERVNDNAKIIHNNGFYFGNNPELSTEDIRTLCNLLQRDNARTYI